MPTAWAANGRLGILWVLPAGVNPYSEEVEQEVADMEKKSVKEVSCGKQSVLEVFIRSRVTYPTLLVMSLQAGKR